jgi:hypothetical protein
MKTRLSIKKPVKETEARTERASRHGIAQSPPAYGIDFIDHTTIPGQPDPGSGAVIQGKTGPSTARDGARGHLQNRSGLPQGLKTGIEDLSGLPMDDVRVHYNSSRPGGLQALAYTQGTEIHVGPGQERHLPHEAWHVVQQKQGRVKPTIQVKGVGINDDAGLEKEADRIGTRSLLYGTTTSKAARESKAAPRQEEPAIQRVRLPVGGVIVETDYYNTDLLENGMLRGARRIPSATTAEKPALENEIRNRNRSGQHKPPGPKSRDLAPKKEDFEKTMQRNEAGRERLRQLVEIGLRSSDELLRNSCEWIKQRKVKLYAGTHLDEDCLRQLGLIYPDTKKFEAGDIYTDPIPYEWQAKFDMDGFNRLTEKVAVEPTGTKGWYENSKIVIVVDALGSEQEMLQYFSQTIKHEVQHAADLHDLQTRSLGSRNEKNLLQHAMIDFDTEYRAHSLMGLREVEAASAEKKEKFRYNRNVTVTQRHNVLCKKVWENIAFKYENNEVEQEPRTEKPFLSQQELQQLFEYMAKADPLSESLNPLNSVRINDFYKALPKRDEVRIAAIYISLPPSEQRFLQETPTAKKHIENAAATGIGKWKTAGQLLKNLVRINQIYEAASHLMGMYGWSPSHVIEEAIQGNFNDLLDKKPASKESYLA